MREIHGYLQNGEQIFLGRIEATDEQIDRFIANLYSTFTKGQSGAFNVGNAVFNTNSFIGIRVS